MLKRKPVFLNGVPVGDAATWGEVAQMVGVILRRTITVREAQAHGREGPESFIVDLER